jgi:HEXXH motif-containing protein
MNLRGPIRDARFEASAERGRQLDQTMRTRLAQSLSHVFDRIGPEISIADDVGAQIVERVLARRQSPQIFGAYYDLVLAVERDEIEGARALAAEISERLDCEPPAWVASLSSRPAADEERYQRLLLPDDIAASEPKPDDFSIAATRIEQAMALLDRGFPGMAAEIRELLFEIVVAAGPSDPGSLTFDGSSSYMLWGAIMLNARGQTNVLDTAQALAHESGHNLLFGLCANGPLIENDDAESFAHPLRQDPRPMDGVVHAAYVTARMHQTVERLLDSGVLDTAQTDAARKELELHRTNFEAADSVIRSAAILTEVGERAIGSARAHLAVPAT